MSVSRVVNDSVHTGRKPEARANGTARVGSSRMRMAALIGGVGLVAPLALLGVAAPAHAAAASTEIDGITYQVASATDATASACDPGAGCGPQVSILDTVSIDGTDYAVSAIGDHAFDSKELSAATIPDSVTTIGDRAFLNNVLTSVTIGESVTLIDVHAFDQNQLTSVTIPDSVTTIEHSAFLNNALTSVTIGESVTVIGDHAFDKNQLASVTIPNAVTTIGLRAFYNNILTSATIGDSVTAIGAGAFLQNPDLANVAFLGPPPATFTAAGSHGSLGADTGLMVHYPLVYAAPALPDGYTTPTWQGYQTVANPTVTFDVGVHGTPIDTANPAYNTSVTRPADPSWTGHIFTGWFTAEAGGIAWDFTTPITADTTVYAHWTEITTPGAPTIGTATAGDAQATVTFTPPIDDGGAAITGFTVTATDVTTPGNGGQTAAAGAAGPITVPGLTNGDTYTFTVSATNSVGTGAESAPSNDVIPATTPDAPVIGTATAGAAQATVTFTPPADDGGSAIIEYTVTVTDTTTPEDSGQTVTGAASPITVTGLTNGDKYTFTVSATNMVGTGPESAASNSVTPLAPTIPVEPVTPVTPANPVDPGLASTGVNLTVPLGLVGLMLATGLAVLGASRLRVRSK